MKKSSRRKHVQRRVPCSCFCVCTTSLPLVYILFLPHSWKLTAQSFKLVNDSLFNLSLFILLQRSGYEVYLLEATYRDPVVSFSLLLCFFVMRFVKLQLGLCSVTGGHIHEGDGEGEGDWWDFLGTILVLFGI